jgi:hypothetical protein
LLEVRGSPFAATKPLAEKDPLGIKVSSGSFLLCIASLLEPFGLPPRQMFPGAAKHLDVTAMITNMTTSGL